MLSAREVAEAEAHERRRLVTAFAHGGDGRQVDPPRTRRQLVAGVALALLLVAGAAALDLVRPAQPADWTGRGLVVVAETGARYIVLEDGARPRPLVNLASALLLLGGPDVPAVVPEAEIASRGVGPPVGLRGAPEVLPAAAELDPPRWAVCPWSAGEVHRPRRPSDDGAPAVTRRGLVARDPGGRLHLLTSSPDGSARRFPFDDADLIHRTALRGARPVPVSSRWLALVPPGPPLRASTLRLPGVGDPPAYADTMNPAAGWAVGDVVVLDGQHYLLGRRVPHLLTRFAAAVHELTTGRPARPVDGLGVTAHSIPRLASWPERFPAPVDDGGACVVLEASDRPAVRLVTPPSESTTAGQALVRGADGTWVLDTAGWRHRVAGSQELGALGYEDVEPAEVPRAWLELFPCGSELSTAAAASGRGRPACRDP